MDALFALSAIVLLSVSYAALASVNFESQKYGNLDQEARDYLYLVHQRGHLFTDAQFEALTGHELKGGLVEIVHTFDNDYDEEANWSVQGTQWSWDNSDGEIYRHASGGANAYEQANASNESGFYWEDYNVSARFKYDAIGTDVGGISARVNASGARYSCILDDMNTDLELWESNAYSLLGRYAQLNSTEYDPTPGSWYRLTLGVSSNFINCSLDDGASTTSVLFTDIEYPLMHGQIALEGTDQAIQYFDNVSISYVPEPHPIHENVTLAMRGSLMQYPRICGCDVLHNDICMVDNDDRCLLFQEQLAKENYTKEAWTS